MVQFQITVRGLSPVDLTVEISAEPLDIAGLTIVEREFSLANPGPSPVTVGLSSVVSGPAASKLGVSFLDDTMIVPAAGSASNKVQVQANEPLFVGEEAVIAVTGEVQA
jgi:hypothetical protein